MEATKQGFAKGFGGEEDSITPQAMPGSADAGAVAAVDQAETMPADGEAVDPAGTAAEIAAELPPADVLEDAGAAGEGGEAMAAEGAGDVVAAEAGDLEMNQAEKSWNGRLTARERELKARAEELEARAAELENQKPLPSYAEATESLTNDFGEDFMAYFKAFVIGAVEEAFNGSAKGTIEDLVGKIEGITEGVRDAMGQIHTEMISSAHEDFEDIAKSPEFKAYVDGLDEEAKAQAMGVIDSGTPRQVVKLLNNFKATLTQGAGDDNKYDAAALDAAAGVRSAGGRAPSLGGDAIAAGDEVERMRAGFYGTGG